MIRLKQDQGVQIRFSLSLFDNVFVPLFVKGPFKGSFSKNLCTDPKRGNEAGFFSLGTFLEKNVDILKMFALAHGFSARIVLEVHVILCHG